MAGNEQWASDKICPPIALVLLLQTNSRANIQKHLSPFPSSIFLPLPLVFVLKEAGKKNEWRDGKAQKHWLTHIQTGTVKTTCHFNAHSNTWNNNTETLNREAKRGDFEYIGVFWCI